MPTEMGPWIDRLREHRLMVGAVAALVALAVALVWVAWRWGVAEDRMAMLQKQADAGFLLAPSSTRTVRIDLRNPGAVSIGGGDLPERVDFLLNARSDRYARFRLSVLREDGTLAFRVDQLVRDSNQDLRLSLNTSILPQGEYELRIEGYGRGGKLERFAQARMRVAAPST
jgi:hypothetical protein